LPRAIREALARTRADNGSELISEAVKASYDEIGSGALYIDSGSPWYNGIVKSFIGGLRDQLPSSEISGSLRHRLARRGNYRALTLLKRSIQESDAVSI
jgi:hypothetical protein